MRRLLLLAILAVLPACVGAGGREELWTEADGVVPDSVGEDVRAPVGVADERDRQAVEAVLLRLLDDPEFRRSPRRAASTCIVLDNRVPAKTGFLQDPQLKSDARPRSIPSALRDGLMRRGGTPGSYESLPASWIGSAFGDRVKLADLDPYWDNTLRGPSFQQDFPDAWGWVSAWLPVYTADGAHALVRAEFGPTAHGATLTAWLRRNGDAWGVEWIEYAYYV